MRPGKAWKFWMWQPPEDGGLVPDYPPIELTDVVITRISTVCGDDCPCPGKDDD